MQGISAMGWAKYPSWGALKSINCALLRVADPGPR